MTEDEFSTENLIKELKRVCPGEPVRLYNVLLWLFEHPKSAEYLCGRAPMEHDTVIKLLKKSREEEQPEFLGLMMYRSARDRNVEIGNEDMEENDM